MSYEIRVISNEEFDTLPYKHVKCALGLADAKNRIAYVRHTGVKDLDNRTIDHEFDELLQKVSPHEEDGIRYKFWIPLIIAALKSAAVGAAVGGSVTKLKGGDFWDGALQGAKYGAIGSGVGSALGGIGGAAAGSTNAAISSIGGGLQKVGSLMGGAKIGGTSASAPASLVAPSQAAQSVVQGAGGISGIGGGVGAGAAAGASAASQGALSGFAGTAGTAAGMASAAMPQSSTPGTTPTPQDAARMTSLGGAPGQSALSAPTSAAAPAGRSLMSKFGDFTYDRAAQFTGDQLKTAAGNAISPSEQGLFPEYRTPASGYGSEGALSRFAPSLSAGGAYTPLSQQEYEQGLSNLYGAKQTRTAELFRQDAFRGQNPNENTALAQQLSGINQGFDLELGQYNKDIDTENLYRRYDSLKKENSLTDDLMNQYIALADKSDDEIAQSVTNSPEEFRRLFKGLKMRA